MSSHTRDGWETVHTVNDYYDRPRGGVADYDGVPHAYRCAWNDAADDWDEVFTLSPISAAQLRDVQEQWEIWRRWKSAHDANALVEGDDHPALAAERSRYEQLEGAVATALRVDGDRAVRAIPEFRGTTDPMRDLQVRWSPA